MSTDDPIRHDATDATPDVQAAADVTAATTMADSTAQRDVPPDPIVTAFYSDGEKPRRACQWPEGGQPFNRNRETHGHWTRKRYVRELGWDRFLDHMDRRTAVGKAWFDKRERIYSDMGGKTEIAETKLTQIDHLMAVDALVDSGLAWVFQPGGLGPINRRNGRFRPIVNELTKLIEASARLAELVGLDRKPKPVPTLQEYLQSEEFKRDLEPDLPEEGRHD